MNDFVYKTPTGIAFIKKFAKIVNVFRDYSLVLELRNIKYKAFRGSSVVERSPVSKGLSNIYK